MQHKLADKVVIVTGASSGIGREMAKALAAMGAKVVLAARESRKLADVAEGIESGAVAIPCDVSSASNIDSLVQQTIKLYGRVDILVANAGVFSNAPFEDVDQEEIGKILDINIDGVMLTCHAVLPYMKKQSAGEILVVGSIAGVADMRNEVIYSATKHAVQAFVRSLRRQVAEFGIRVGVICPGTVATELWGLTDENEIARRVKNKTVLSARNIVDASVFMLSQPDNVTIRELVILPTCQDI